MTDIRPILITTEGMAGGGIYCSEVPQFLPARPSGKARPEARQNVGK